MYERTKVGRNKVTRLQKFAMDKSSKSSLVDGASRFRCSGKAEIAASRTVKD